MKALIKDGKVAVFPCSFAQLKKDNPDTSFPRKTTAIEHGFGIEEVYKQEEPVYNPDTQQVEIDKTPVFIDGRWVLSKKVVDLTVEQVAVRKNRNKRQVVDRIDEILHNKIYAGIIPYTFPGDTDPDGIQMQNEADRMNIQEFIIGGLLGTADTFSFMPASNIKKTMSAEQVISMGKFLNARWSRLMDHSWTLKTAVAEAETAAEIQAIDIHAGWPV